MPTQIRTLMANRYQYLHRYRNKSRMLTELAIFEFLFFDCFDDISCCVCYLDKDLIQKKIIEIDEIDEIAKYRGCNHVWYPPSNLFHIGMA